jgi:hypothetical protein
MKNLWKRLAWMLTALAMVYSGSYLVNSFSGGYWLTPERDGGNQSSSGLSMHTAILWQPRIVYNAKFNSDWTGAFYAPLVMLDRAFWHPTKYVTDTSTFTWIAHEAAVSDVHPHFRNEFESAKSKESNTSAQPTSLRSATDQQHSTKK